MRAGNRVLTTQAPPEEFERIFTEYLERGCDIVYIGCSLKQSGSVNTGSVVAKRLLERYPGAEIFCIDSLIARLSALGDSIVAFQTGTVVKVHVHTMTPGAVLNDCQRFGEFLPLKIENMTLQHHETVIRNDFSPQPQEGKKPFAVVTVASGAGVIEALRAMGADQVIDGGQTDNPSAEEFLAAFRAARAETIFVLPNNASVILAAKQAAGLYEGGGVRVIETRTLGEGYAALSMLSYDSGDADEIEQELRELYPGANIFPVDYDAGASKVNQENRIKLMLAMAKEAAV